MPYGLKLELSDIVPIKCYTSSTVPIEKSVANIVAYGIANNLGNAFVLLDSGNTRSGCDIRYFNITGNTAYLGSLSYINYSNQIGIGDGTDQLSTIQTISATGYRARTNGDIASGNVSHNWTIQTSAVIDGIRYYRMGGNAGGNPEAQAFYLPDTVTNIYIDGNPLVTYEWQSVPAISGKNGILSLTQITDEAIGDGSQKMHQPYESILRFTDQSNIRQLIRNLPQNERRVIAYSGLNRLEVMWHDSVEYPDSAEYTLYFVNHYGEGNNQYYSTIYQISGSLPYDGTEDKYLSMIIDRENEVAKYSEVTLIHDPTIPDYNNTVNYSYYSPSSTEMAALYLFIIGGDDEPQDEDDPYATGSTDGGGDGNPFQPQDHLGLNNKPTKSGLNLGFVTLYKPTETQLDDIARFMWSDDVLDNFKKYFNNFADNIISLMIIPYNLTSLPSKKFKVGNMESDAASLQSVEYVTDRYVDIDMGDFYIDRKWDSYLDCSPYSKLEIYLPYCGTHSLDTDEIMYPANLDGFIPDTQGDPHLHINYRLDVATGNIVATLLVNDEIRYQFTGKCGMTVPLTGADYQNLVLGSITAGAGLAATIASGGATAPMTMSAAVTGTVMSQKPNNYRSGNMSGDISRLGFDTPYLIKTIPNLPEIKNQKSFTGYPSYRYGSIGSFSGFTQMIEAHIDNVSCTDAERDKIMAYLKEGVII